MHDVAHAPARPRERLLVAGAAVLLVAGVVLRLLTASDLWLDEALTVNISRLPLGEIPGALRVDGAPPLYYVLLHLWMRAAGDGDLAARLPSAAASLATLPVVWAVGRRLGGRSAAWASTILLATNPFAIRYATEARMYALVALEAALGALLLLRAQERPSPGRLAGVAATAAALLYTHYWALFLLGATGLLLLVRAWRLGGASWRERAGGVDARCLAALALGGAVWSPWVPTFLTQAAHTGTPWAAPAGPAALSNVIAEFAGGTSEGARVLALLLAVLLVLGVLGRTIDGRRVELDLRGRPAGRPLLAVALGAPALALAAGLLSGAAFVARYTSVVLPAFVLLCGLGVAALGGRRAMAVVLAAAGALGLGLAGQQALRNRTQAGEIAGYLAARAGEGDVVAFCPDQLGPATLRLVGERRPAIGWPRGDDPRLIDWYDYQDVNEAASPAAFAQLLLDRAGPSGDVWLVANSTYRTALKSCTEVEARLLALRPDGHTVVRARPGKYFEESNLVHYPAPA